MRRLGTAAPFAAALACAAGTGDRDASGGMTGVASADSTSTSGLASDSIATAWESSQSATDTSSSGVDTGDGSTSTSTTTSIDPTSESSGGGEDSSSGAPPMPVNLFENPSLEEWTNAMEPNTTPDQWDNCTIGGLGVDAVPDSCDGIPAVQHGARYARAFAGEGIEQTVETTPGVTYRISFDYTEVDNCFGGEPSARWEALVDEDQILVTRNVPDIGWQSDEVLFEAQQPTTTICIRKFANGAGGLDNLSVVEVP